MAVRFHTLFALVLTDLRLSAFFKASHGIWFFELGLSSAGLLETLFLVRMLFKERSWRVGIL